MIYIYSTFFSKIQKRFCPNFLRLRFSISAIIKWVKTLQCRACSLWNSSIVYFYTRLLYWRSWGHVVLSVKRNSCLYTGLRLLFWHKSWACFQICPFLTYRNCSLKYWIFNWFAPKFSIVYKEEACIWLHIVCGENRISLYRMPKSIEGFWWPPMSIIGAHVYFPPINLVGRNCYLVFTQNVKCDVRTKD